MISLENIERSYKTGAGQTWVLRRINLKIDAGEFITIMGPSGAGKSSLLNVLALLDDQWAGAYWFHGEAVHSMNRKQRAELARRNIGMVFQSYHLLDDLNVAENIDLPLSYKNISRSERQSLVADTLDRFNIVGKKDLFPNQLSGGQQQLVGIARAVIHRPSLLLADEPTGNLHSSQAKEIMELFQQLNRGGNNHRAGHPLGGQCCLRQSRAGGAGWLAGARYCQPRAEPGYRGEGMRGVSSAGIVVQKTLAVLARRWFSRRPASRRRIPQIRCRTGRKPDSDSLGIKLQGDRCSLLTFSCPALTIPSALICPSSVPEPDLSNSLKLDQLIREGKLYLSIRDAIQLALENNLDLAIARYNLPIADTDILRTKAGGFFRGVNTGVVQTTQTGGGWRRCWRGRWRHFERCWRGRRRCRWLCAKYIGSRIDSQFL